MSSYSYPKVHSVGSGVYYAYRPITRFIEKADRYHIRENSSRPKDFSHYLHANSSVREPGTYTRGSSLPPFDLNREEKSKKAQEEPAGGIQDDLSSFKQKKKELLNEMMKDDFFQRGMKNDNKPITAHDDAFSRHRERVAARRMEEEAKAFENDKDALFVTGEDAVSRLRRKHPFRLPVENEVVPPHESSIWPENRPHFDLVSSYDCMVDYLGIREKGKN